MVLRSLCPAVSYARLMSYVQLYGGDQRYVYQCEVATTAPRDPNVHLFSKLCTLPIDSYDIVYNSAAAMAHEREQCGESRIELFSGRRLVCTCEPVFLVINSRPCRSDCYWQRLLLGHTINFCRASLPAKKKGFVFTPRPRRRSV
ncbi:jg2359 [Pararge aegeria aegeria]|uniref:Jg2359 protein n=1 Tax=Pararge aegeria aegeria TaxID=348720 RepID=A0A8S4S8B8_9NEOP|nr:jg2359 [Pararge aegeria aegeria]